MHPKIRIDLTRKFHVEKTRKISKWVPIHIETFLPICCSCTNSWVKIKVLYKSEHFSQFVARVQILGLKSMFYTYQNFSPNLLLVYKFLGQN